MQCIFKVLNYSFPLSWIYHLICELYHRGAKQHSGCSCRDTVQMALPKTSNTKSSSEIKGAEWGQFGLCSTAKENHLGENSACCRYLSLTSIQNKTEWLGLQGKKIQIKKRNLDKILLLAILKSDSTVLWFLWWWELSVLWLQTKLQPKI